MSSTLANKAVLVTGAAGGLGKAIASAALSAGANVVGVDINADLLGQCEAELSTQSTSSSSSPSSSQGGRGGGGTFHALQADVTSEADARRIFSEAVSKFGHVDALVNNAGAMDRFDPVGDLDMAVFDRLMALNVRAPVFLSKLAVAHFLEKKEVSKPPGGSIVNIGSESSFRGGAAGATYTASKHALKGVTLNTAAAYGAKGIRCNILMPGAMRTHIADSFKAGVNMDGYAMMEKTMAAGAPMVDVGNVARMTVHLMSDYADGINGACITADGGWGAF